MHEKTQNNNNFCQNRGKRTSIAIFDDAAFICDDVVRSAIDLAVEAIETDLPTQEAFINGHNERLYHFDIPEWSAPVFKCPEEGCDGGMCRNNFEVCCSLPPKNIYRCNKCGHTTYLPY